MWFDHEAGTGGGLVDLVARARGLSRREALDWTADRIGMAADVGQLRRPGNRAKRPAADLPDTSARPTPKRGHEAPAETAARPEATSPAATAADRAARLWEAAYPAPADHPYLRRKQVGPNGLRCDSAGNLIVPLRDVGGVLHTIETITSAGEKRYLAPVGCRGSISATASASADPRRTGGTTTRSALSPGG